MKKLAVMVLVGMMAFAMCACDELKEAQESLNSDFNSMLGEASELKDTVDETIYGSSSTVNDEESENFQGSNTDNQLKINLSKQDALTLSSAVKTFYSSVVSGKLNSESEDAIRAELSAELPAKDESTAEKTQKAMKFTIDDVIRYEKLNDISIDEMCFADQGFGTHQQGDILSKSDPDIQGYENYVSDLKRQTTLGRLFANP
ncbi:MAG: hypothetical protein IJ192_00220 [Clostridia bacterium]|nr:hypothetical protein [Clostridia bacterium]MBR2176362.1 hypothetical protein [Clostridia bacterium]